MGSRNGREARITIDGIDAVDEHVGTTTLNISQDSIQEFQVSVSSSDPSAGLSATGAINIITKRGGNDLHGSAFLFGRGSDYAARPELRHDQAGLRSQAVRQQSRRTARSRTGCSGSPTSRRRRRTRRSASARPYCPQPDVVHGAIRCAVHDGARPTGAVSQSNDLFVRWSRDDNDSLGNFGGNRLPSSGNVNCQHDQSGRSWAWTPC